MRALIVSDDGSLSVGELPDPTPARDEVVLEIRATALNRADLLQVKGLYPPPPGESEVPGLECAGVVAEVGSDVDGIMVGDRRMALLAGGGHAQRVAVPAAQTMPIPRALSFSQAAALPEAALTAWTNLVVEGGLAKGQTVLITAAASGVGTFATQLAHALGARVLVAGRSRERLEPLVELGADGCCLLGAGMREEVLEANEGRGVDLILDLVGGSQLDATVAALRPLGRLVLVGLMAGPRAEINLGVILRNRLRIVGSVLRARSREEKAGLVQSFWQFAGPRLESGELAPVVDRVMDFEQIPQAYPLMEEGGLFGKLVLEVST